jgi:hypothetical protein
VSAPWRTSSSSYLPGDSIVDGELVVLASGPDGEPGQDFNRLWGTVFGAAHDRLSLVVFDAPQLAGKHLVDRPWHERRSALEAALPAAGAAVSLIDVFDADQVVHNQLVTLGFKGSVLKRRDGRYLPGQRSRSWQKHKTRASTQAVVEVAIPDRASAVVERIGCRAPDDPERLTWATVWYSAHRMRLTRDPHTANRPRRHADVHAPHGRRRTARGTTNTPALTRRQACEPTRAAHRMVYVPFPSPAVSWRRSARGSSLERSHWERKAVPTVSAQHVRSHRRRPT